MYKIEIKAVRSSLINSSSVIDGKQNLPLGKDFLFRQTYANYMADGFGSFSSLNCEAYHEFQNQ